MKILWTVAFVTLALTLPLLLRADDHSQHIQMKKASSESTPEPPAEDDDISMGGKVFPNTVLTTHEGKQVRFFEDLIKGKVVAINFIFTSCGNSCPLETARLKRVQSLLGERMGKDTFFYSISIDPDTDTPEVLAAYRKKFNIGPGWTFLTGSKVDVDNLQRKLGVYVDETNKRKPKQDHMLSIIIGNQKTGQWLKRSNMDNAQVLAHNIEQLHPEQKNRLELQEYTEAPVKIEGYTEGVKLYLTRCMDCHTIGGGDGIGPDLLGVTKIRDREWLTQWIKEPDLMLQGKDPIALTLLNKFQQIPMPNLRLNNADVQAIIEFLYNEDKLGGKEAMKQK